MEGNSPKIGIPAFGVLWIYGILIGILQLGMVIATPGQFLFMPMAPGSLPFDILFFCAGVWARRNNWLPAIFNLSNSQIAHVYSVTAVVIAIFFAITGIAYSQNVADFSKGK